MLNAPIGIEPIAKSAIPIQKLIPSKPIKKAEYLGTACCGMLKTDGRSLFIVTLTDDTVQLIQVKEGSREYLKLMELSYE